MPATTPWVSEAQAARRTPAPVFSDQRRGVLIGAAVKLHISRRVIDSPITFIDGCLDAPERLPTGSTALGVAYYLRDLNCALALA